MFNLAIKIFPCPPYKGTNINIKFEYANSMVITYNPDYDTDYYFDGFHQESRYHHVRDWVNNICAFLTIPTYNVSVICDDRLVF